MSKWGAGVVSTRLTVQQKKWLVRYAKSFQPPVTIGVALRWLVEQGRVAEART